MMFARFQVEDVVDSGGVQMVGGRALNGERFRGDFRLVRLQGHGLTTHPQPGAVGVALFPFGDRQRGYLLGLESTGLRPKSQPAGASVLYGANGEIVSLVQNKVRVVASEEAIFSVGGMTLRVRPGRIDLGAMEAPNKVMTEAGPSSKVFAVV